MHFRVSCLHGSITQYIVASIDRRSGAASHPNRTHIARQKAETMKTRGRRKLCSMSVEVNFTYCEGPLGFQRSSHASHSEDDLGGWILFPPPTS
jgi:hypothetical protein